MEMLVRLMLLFTIFSVTGYIIEVILCSIGQKRVSNRGFLFGPYLPIYGFGGILMMLTTREIQDNFLLTFLVSMGVCSALEYFTSFLMEKLWHVRWWDYSDERVNLNGRICMRNSLAFGISGCILVYSALPFVTGMIDWLPWGWQVGFSIFFLVIFVLDTIASSYANSKAAKVVRGLSKMVDDQTREIKRQANRAIAQLFKRKPAKKH